MSQSGGGLGRGHPFTGHVSCDASFSGAAHEAQGRDEHRRRARCDWIWPDTTPVQQSMTQELVGCFDHQHMRVAARLMEGTQVRRLVVDRDKQLLGIVSLGDLAIETANDRLRGQVLEEDSGPVHPAG